MALDQGSDLKALQATLAQKSQDLDELSQALAESKKDQQRAEDRAAATAEQLEQLKATGTGTTSDLKRTIEGLQQTVEECRLESSRLKGEVDTHTTNARAAAQESVLVASTMGSRVLSDKRSPRLVESQAAVKELTQAQGKLEANLQELKRSLQEQHDLLQKTEMASGLEITRLKELKAASEAE